MMDEKLLFPEFPKSTMGLQRGSILRAVEDIPQLGFKRGDRFPIGFDGQYVRCLGFTWSIDQIEDEILRGVWTITGEVADLSDPAKAKHFAEKIEQRTATTLQ